MSQNKTEVIIIDVTAALCSYLVNGDDSGVSDEDRAMVDEFVDDQLDDAVAVDFAPLPYHFENEESALGICDILRQWSDTVQLEMILTKENKEK